MIGRTRQRGVALITALLAVAIVTVLAVELTRQQHFDIRRTQNLLGRDQAAVYQQAVEQWALTILAEDARRTETDHRGEAWAEAIEPPPFQGAQMRLQLFDLQDRFNLNNLVTRPGTDNAPASRRMTRLLASLEADTGIVQATADWIDPEPGTRYPDGASDDWYSRLDPPYRVANRRMASASELRLVKGVDDALWRRLAPLVTALPEPTPININTASPQVLSSIAEGLTLTQAEELVANRPPDGWQSVEEFLSQSVFAGEDIPAEGLSVSSDYFLLRSEIELGRTTIRQEAVLQRGTNDGGRVIQRRRGFTSVRTAGGDE